MAIEDFFNHTCDIYHIVSEGTSPGYNLPSSPSFSYPATPDEASVPCHFGVKSFSYSIQQTQPKNEYDVKIKLALPIGTDIRLNDKVVEPTTGYEYTAELPRNVRNHHLFVYLKRTDAQKPL